jgi:hypothetical protein
MGKRRGAYRALVGKREGKGPFGRPRHRWEDNIKMDLQEVGCAGTDWIELAEDRDRWESIVNAVRNIQIPVSLLAENRLGSQGLCCMELVSKKVSK